MDIVIPKSAGFVADFQNHTHLPNGHAQQQKLRCALHARHARFWLSLNYIIYLHSLLAHRELGDFHLW